MTNEMTAFSRSGRILIAIETDVLVKGFLKILADPLSAPVTEQALVHMRELMAEGVDAPIAMMAGRAEAGLGEPETVALSTHLLTRDLFEGLYRHQ